MGQAPQHQAPAGHVCLPGGVRKVPHNVCDGHLPGETSVLSSSCWWHTGSRGCSKGEAELEPVLMQGGIIVMQQVLAGRSTGCCTTPVLPAEALSKTLDQKLNSDLRL